MGMRRRVSAYIRTRASTVPRYLWNGLVLTLCAWVPGLAGIALRAVAYRLILRARGLPAIERGVRLRRPEDVTLGRGVFVDTDVVLDAGAGGLEIGDGSVVMSGCLLQWSSDAGMLNWGYFIIGLPGETEETIRQTIAVLEDAGARHRPCSTSPRRTRARRSSRKWRRTAGSASASAGRT